MLQLGPHRVSALEDGRFALDGGAMFGLVPRPVWEKQLAPDAQNRVELALRCLLVQSDGRNVLIDTGMGDKWGEKAGAMYALSRERTLLGDLAALGLGPHDITDVVLTHLHFDHAGGVTRLGEGGKLELTFPRATHHVQRRNWTWAQRPTERDRGSYRAENFALLAGSPRLRLLDGPEELLPCLHLFLSEGHAPGVQLVRLEGGARTLLYCADLIPTSVHLNPAWAMSYDLHPVVVIEEKKALLAQALEEGAALVFEHDPRLAACTVREEQAPGGSRVVVNQEVLL